MKKLAKKTKAAPVKKKESVVSEIEKIKKTVRQFVDNDEDNYFYLNTYDDYAFMSKRIRVTIYTLEDTGTFMLPFERKTPKEYWILFILKFDKKAKLAPWVKDLNLPIYTVEVGNVNQVMRGIV